MSAARACGSLGVAAVDYMAAVAGWQSHQKLMKYSLKIYSVAFGA